MRRTITPWIGALGAILLLTACGPQSEPSGDETSLGAPGKQPDAPPAEAPKSGY